MIAIGCLFVHSFRFQAIISRQSIPGALINHITFVLVLWRATIVNLESDITPSNAWSEVIWQVG